MEFFLVIMFMGIFLAVIILIAIGMSGVNRLPDILEGATLFKNEENLRIYDPINLSGRPDQVWKSKSEKLVIVDTKVRQNNQVYESDRIQLSAYAVMLKNHPLSKNMEVHPVGYIRRHTSGGGQYIAVQLYPEEKVIELHERYWQVHDQEIPPKTNGGSALCHHCGHRKTCVKFN